MWVCVTTLCTVSNVCLQGELRCWYLASLLFNEYLWRWQVHVQPFFYKLSNKQASPLSLPLQLPLSLAESHYQQHQTSDIANKPTQNTSEALASAYTPRSIAAI